MWDKRPLTTHHTEMTKRVHDWPESVLENKMAEGLSHVKACRKCEQSTVECVREGPAPQDPVWTMVGSNQTVSLFLPLAASQERWPCASWEYFTQSYQHSWRNFLHLRVGFPNPWKIRGELVRSWVERSASIKQTGKKECHSRSVFVSFHQKQWNLINLS